MSKHKRIFIIGHTGAGKGVLAKALADKLGWKLINADFGLAPSIGRDMSEILGKQGEETFHRCLSDILSNQISQENIVVTTDESIVCLDKNRQLLSDEFTVHLKVSTAVQLQRIAHNHPLLPVADYKSFLEKLHQERDALYDKTSCYAVNSDNGAIEDHVFNIINALKSC